MKREILLERIDKLKTSHALVRLRILPIKTGRSIQFYNLIRILKGIRSIFYLGFGIWYIGC